MKPVLSLLGRKPNYDRGPTLTKRGSTLNNIFCVSLRLVRDCLRKSVRFHLRTVCGEQSEHAQSFIIQSRINYRSCFDAGFQRFFCRLFLCFYGKL